MNKMQPIYRKAIVVAFGYFIIATAFGVYAAQIGISAWVPIALSIFVFAGASQFLAVQLIAAASPLMTIVIAGFLLNLRHIFYAMLFRKSIVQSSRLKTALTAGLLTDEVFGLMQAEKDHAPLVKIELLVYSQWILGTIVGVFVGSSIPTIKGLDFVLTALFTVLAVDACKELWKTRRTFSPVMISLIVGLVLSFIVTQHYLLVGLLVTMGIILLQKRGSLNVER